MKGSVRRPLFAALLLLGAACADEPTGPGALALTVGDSVTVSGGTGSERLFRIDVPPGTPGLSVTLTGGSGDADLYLRRGARPSPDEADCASESFGGPELCYIPAPAEGSWQILVYGFEPYTNLTLRATFGADPPSTPLVIDTPLTNLAGAENSIAIFKVTVPAAAPALTITTTGGTGDVDVYVARTFTQATADCSSAGGANDESCSVANPAAGIWWVVLQGFEAYTGVTLSASLVAPTLQVSAEGATILQHGTSLSAPRVGWPDLRGGPRPRAKRSP